jgi:hypothetical protein
MNAVQFLYAALIATAIIHGTYLTNLFRRYLRLKQQLKDLGKSG